MIKRWSASWLVILLLLLVVALGIVAAGRLTAQSVQAQTPPPLEPMAGFSGCTVVDVGVFIQRIHVRCTATVNVGGNLIAYWAYPTSDSAGASRFLSLFETAKATSSTLSIFYEPNDLTGSAFGCNNSDCRRIVGASLP